MRNIKLALCCLLLVALVYIGCQTKASEEAGVSTSAALEREVLVAKGNYIVTTGMCDDCHTPKKMTDKGPQFDMERRLMGHPSDMPIPRLPADALDSWVLMDMNFTYFVGPWGLSYAANITSDPTGIGLWTEEQFFRSMREGKHKGLKNGRELLPPMPWEVIAQRTDEDLKAMWAYLQSTEPIRNIVPPPQPPEALKSYAMVEQ